MADKKKDDDVDDKKEVEVAKEKEKKPAIEPEAEAEDEKKGNDDDGKDDEKEKEKIVFNPERIPKEDPGDGLPKKEPEFIEFKWNKEFKDKKSTDTQHMLYLLQLALNLVRLRTIERNKYFKSIGRTDRFINQLDNPQVITNFLDWHNKDKDNNKFDGELLYKSEKLFMINKMISEIGGMKKGPATRVFTKLKKDVIIETTTWLELPQPKLKLKNWGYTKMYKGEKVIDECTVEEMVRLLKNGVLQAVVDANAAKNKPSALESVDKWQEKICQYFIDNQLDGKKFMETGVKDTCKSIMDALEKGNNKLRGGVNQVIRGLKKCYVHELLSKG